MSLPRAIFSFVFLVSIALPFPASAIEPSFLKTAQVLRDPVSGSVNPYAIPGAVVRYAVRFEPLTEPDLDNDAVLMIQFADNLSDNTALDPDLLQVDNTPESAADDFLKVTIVSDANRCDVADATKPCVCDAGTPKSCVLYYSATDPGVVAAGSNGRAFGQTISLTFAAMTNFLTADLANGALLLNELRPPEYVVIEYNAVVR